MSELIPFSLIIKPSGSQCNFACDYCYYLKKKRLYPGSNFHMSETILDKFTQQYLASQPDGDVFFIWQGGEPTLMGIPFFEKAISLQRQYQRPNQHIKNALQTNGFLLNDAWGMFLKENDFLVGLSIDGPSYLHDVHRKDKAGRGTHTHVLAALELLQKYEVDINILTCVSDANVRYPLDVYRYFRDSLGIQHMQFIPIVERENLSGNQRGDKLTDRSISGKEYGEFLIAIFDEWVSRDVGKVFVQIFEVCLGVWLGYPSSLCIFNETCGTCMALEHTGDLYACDHYVQPDFFLGNISTLDINDMATSERQKKFGQNKKALLPQKCLHCDVLFICNGGCPKNRIIPPKGETSPINHLCEGYQSFFHHIDQPMKLMASLMRMNHPVADVMTLLKGT